MNMLLIDGAKFKLWTPTDEEKQFHPMIKEHHKEIFGEDSIYFDVKQVIRSSSGIGAIPDAYAIKLYPPRWYVIENELATHPIYEHIVNQLTRFINGIENQSARIPIIDAIYSKINEDIVLKAVIRKNIGTDDIYHFIYKLISSPPKIVIIIDEKTSETEDACHIFKYPTEIIEFKTYVRENAETIHAHFFEPLCEGTPNNGKQVGQKSASKSTPEYQKTWEAKINWVNPQIKQLANDLIEKVAKFGNIDHGPSGPDYKFYKGKRTSTSIFCGLFLTHDTLKIRIRTDPTKTSDPHKWLSERTYKWFMPSGNEKEFIIKDTNQLEYAIELIKQAYSLAI
jgi:predicted transport protein